MQIKGTPLKRLKQRLLVAGSAESHGNSTTELLLHFCNMKTGHR